MSLPDPCDIRFFPNSVACMAKGGKADTDPCNVLNPVHDINACNASKIGKEVFSSKYGWILIVVLVVMVGPLILLILAYMIWDYRLKTQYGGSKKRGLSKFVKRFL